jgi:hypothetical protein
MQQVPSATHYRTPMAHRVRRIAPLVLARLQALTQIELEMFLDSIELAGDKVGTAVHIELAPRRREAEILSGSVEV